ncbi:hypothetical protein QUA43_30830 [Microcoleus sp. N9_B4]|uniref:hypothetical protein n=1 Tax=Microcoleus sp. N9_B4 TaxID=3055386 RepID=UPI002FD58E3B
MSLQLRLFGGGQVDTPKNGSSLVTNDGGHNIDKATALKATSADAISPMNPGNFASGERSVPIVPAPRYFDKEEAAAMKTLATEKEKGAKYSKKAYEALGRIEAADAKVHKHHRKYEGVVATNELRKVRANAGLAKHLHGLRPGYARLDARIDKADSNARADIDAIKAQLTGGAN